VIAVYVSGHGFGHTTRVCEVLRALRRRAPEQPLAVVTSAPESLYHEAGFGPFTFRADECDVGLAQRGALVIDGPGTVARWRAFVADWSGRVEREASWLRTIGAQAVLGDIPPLAFAAAEAAGLPGLAMANFSWDWIYAYRAGYEPALLDAVAWAEDGYGRAERLFRLPFYGDLSAFRQIEDVPLVARRPMVDRATARRRLRLPLAEPIVLLSFGGIGLQGFEAGRWGAMAPYEVVVSENPGERPANVHVVDRPALHAAGLGYADLVAAADVVVTKPGYGIVTDCIGAGTGLVYTDRGDFPEYPILVEQMARWLPCAYVTHAQLAEAQIQEAVEAVRSKPLPPPPDLGGAEVVAERLLEVAG
jgi:L-arabinokinase